MFGSLKTLHKNWTVIISAVTINTFLLGLFNHMDHMRIRNDIIKVIRERS